MSGSVGKGTCLLAVSTESTDTLISTRTLYLTLKYLDQSCKIIEEFINNRQTPTTRNNMNQTILEQGFINFYTKFPDVT